MNFAHFKLQHPRRCCVKMNYSKTCLKRLLKKNTKIGFQYQLSLNAGQKYCRMLPLEHSAILSTFIKLPFPLRPLFCLFLSGRLRQVLLFVLFVCFFVALRPMSTAMVIAGQSVLLTTLFPGQA